ncbi:hypothetical protein EVAR_53743_1 [Eumeta japonica]|uniref:Uncharacterized protein n=1 Tax=Eumeta variegata TaxID=151549 RepID=A0A4C1ZF25_EUMVA|nr:hypothetical protein EVAR_53743_1 [Eumeta japonica]
MAVCTIKKLIFIHGDADDRAISGRRLRMRVARPHLSICVCVCVFACVYVLACECMGSNRRRDDIESVKTFVVSTRRRIGDRAPAAVRQRLTTKKLVRLSFCLLVGEDHDSTICQLNLESHVCCDIHHKASSRRAADIWKLSIGSERYRLADNRVCLPVRTQSEYFIKSLSTLDKSPNDCDRLFG